MLLSSTRTRASSKPVWLSSVGTVLSSRATTQISHGDTAKEIGEICGRYFDGIAIRHCDRGIGNSYLNEVAKNCVPILNMQCDVYHPFQCLVIDRMTIMEKKGRDLPQKDRCLLGLCRLLPENQSPCRNHSSSRCRALHMDVTLAYPKEFMLSPDRTAGSRTKPRSSTFEIVHDMDEGMKDADIIYAKSWHFADHG